MKEFIKNWWPLLLIAGWWLWRIKKNRKPVTVDVPVQTVTLHDGSTYTVPDTCPKCGAPVDHLPGCKGFVAKCTNSKCSYGVAYSMDGSEAGECSVCGSKKHYRYVRSTVDGCSIINFPVCDNPECKSHQLDY